MIELVFPDGAARPFGASVSGRDVAAAISKSLAKKAVAPTRSAAPAASRSSPATTRAR